MADANARLVAANSWPFLTSGFGTKTVDSEIKIRMRVINTGVGPALRPGLEIPFLELKQSANPALFATLQKAMFSPEFKLIVCYCSIFDECLPLGRQT